MKPLNLRVILLLGGIFLITLAFQIFQRYTVENFVTAPPATPPATTSTALTTPAVTPPANGTPGSAGVTFYTIPVGNDQFIKLEIPVQPATGVSVPQGPVPSTTPPIK
jgi:hypothetical protein